MPRLLAVAIAILAAAAFAGGQLAAPASATTATFTLPPFHVGDLARYHDSADGPLNLSILEPTTVLDKSMRPRTVTPVRYDAWGVTEYLSPSTMTMEAFFADCATARNPDGSCMRPYQSWQWYRQGAPAVMGATYLQGRSFHVGDAWDVPGECAECTWRRVTIEAPDALSPPGTDFIADVQGDYVATAFKGRIHMSGSSPFPLLVEWAVWGTTTRLLGVDPGATPIVPPSPPELASYVPLLPVLPFADGRPVEGTPIPGWPSWSDARNASGPLAPEASAGARFVSAQYPSPLYTTVDVPSPGLASATSHQIKARYAVAGAPDEVTTYHAVTASGLDAQGPVVYSGASRSTEGPTALPPCPERSVVVWDAVRAALDLPYLHGFEGVEIKAPRASNCRGELRITGQIYFPPDGGFGVSEHVSILATEGFLRHANTIVQP